MAFSGGFIEETSLPTAAGGPSPNKRDKALLFTA
jgi:hypothetical protein